MSASSRRRRLICRADLKMMRELGQLGSDTEGERLRIFRDYLASTICLASPLLLDACKPDELDEAFWRLRPNPCWPKRSRVQTRINGRQCESRHGQKMGFKAIEMDEPAVRSDRTACAPGLSAFRPHGAQDRIAGVEDAG